MKYLISRGKYARITAGMSPADRAELDEIVELYPDEVEPPPVVADQDRIAARFAELLEQPPPVLPPPPVPPPTPASWAAFAGWDTTYVAYDEMRRPGSVRWAVADPWEEVGPGVWVAPLAPDPAWIRLSDLEDQILAAQEAAGQRWEQIMRLIQIEPDGPPGIVTTVAPTPAAPDNALDSIRLWLNDYKKANPASHPAETDGGPR